MARNCTINYEKKSVVKRQLKTLLTVSISFNTRKQNTFNCRQKLPTTYTIPFVILIKVTHTNKVGVMFLWIECQVEMYLMVRQVFDAHDLTRLFALYAFAPFALNVFKHNLRSNKMSQTTPSCFHKNECTTACIIHMSVILANW